MNKYKIIPLAVAPLKKTVRIPGSKSYTNRALILAALAKGESVITGVSEGDDSVAMIKALTQLGIKVLQTGNSIKIIGNGGEFPEFKGTIDVGAGGTTMRFLASLCATIEGETILKGSERMHERPIFELVDALRELGVKIDYLQKEGCPPLKIFGQKHLGKKMMTSAKKITNAAVVSMDGSFSSQYFTSLLLIGGLLKQDLVIKVKGEQISRSYIDMTIDGLDDFGITVENNNYSEYKIKSGQNYHARSYHVEGDASGASYFMAIAAINGKNDKICTIRVENLNVKSAQGDIKFADLLERMGCSVKRGKDFIEVTGNGVLNGIDVDMELMPDTAQTLAVVAAFAKGTTRITGLGTLKIKETDRILAVATELGKMGITCRTGEDWIEIDGGQPQANNIDTYKDHRMAMSFAVAGSRLEGMVINDPDVVSKSLPEFWQLLAELGVKHEPI